MSYLGVWLFSILPIPTGLDRSIFQLLSPFEGSCPELQNQRPNPKYHPADEFVADFIGESNFLHATVTDKIDADTALCSFEGQDFEVCGCSHVEKGSACCIVLRPESARLADTGVLSCEVVLSRFMGHYQNYQVIQVVLLFLILLITVL